MMKTLRFPYGKKHITLEVPEERLSAVLQSHLQGYMAEGFEEELVQRALENPIGAARLCEMAKGKNKIVIIASDHTRPVPSKIIMPLMLREIRRGNPQAEITILIATGCHRGTTKAELADKFGHEIVRSEKIVIHDCDDADNLVSLGRLPSGGELMLNRLAVEADLLCAEGFIEPHFFAGFSGGRKSVLPGIAGRKTVLANHCAEFIADPCSRTGILEGNPIHRDMIFAARAVGLDFIVNVIINAEKEVIYAVAGDCGEAHCAGCDFLKQYCRVEAVPADIAISTNGGYPLDQNIYQAVKGMTAAEATVRQGGVIIMLAASSDGHGGKLFYETFRNEKNLSRMMQKFLHTPREETVPDQWQSQVFARVLQRARVIFVSEAPDGMVRDLHMLPAHSLQEALEKADELLGYSGGTITAIPDGVSVAVTAQ